MKKLLATVLMLGLAQGAMAADAPKDAPKDAPQDKTAGDNGPEGKGPEGKGPHGGERMFGKIDTNHDGFISKAEAAAFHDEEFTKQDANHDGKLSKEELQAFHKAKMEERRKEHPGFGKGKFPRGDKGEEGKTGDAPKDAPKAD